MRYQPNVTPINGGGTITGARRHLTVLFCDVVGSTMLAERLDPEDFRDLLTSYHRVCRDAIVRHEGHLSQFLGDGVLAYFGYPVAHEDDAVRAVHTALNILETIKLVNQGIGKRLQAQLQLRIGLDSGLTVIGEVATHAQPLAVGEPVSMATAIEAFAEQDTIVISGATAKLVQGHFELQPLQSHTLKGFTRTVELFRVIEPTGARTRFEAAARGRLTPHVGRERELDELARAWSDVRDGADRLVFVRGEAGIGKSRMVHQFRNGALGDSIQVLECFCSPLSQGTALAPIIELLFERIALRADGKTTPEARLEALAALLGEHSRFGADALPLVAALLSIPGADEAPLAELSPIRRRARTLQILRAWLGWSAERVPVALFIEDIHWADPSTLDLLELLVREPPGGRCLICVTSRPEFALRPEFPARWTGPHTRIFDLTRLSAPELELIVTFVAGGHALPPLVMRRITERSEGVPLFAEEVTKAILESGAVRLAQNRYELAGTFDEKLLPSTVHGSVVARFDHLGESRRIAQLGAAIGREFAYPLIRAVAGLSDDALRTHLDRLTRSELAFVRGEPPASVYSFKHALIQDAIYATLLKRERGRVHQAIFASLIDEFPQVVAARPEMAAYHAESAGQREAAVPLLRDAGLKALARTAVAEAVQHLRHGIELVSALNQPERTTMELELLAALGPAYMATVGWAAPEVETASARLRDLASAHGDGPKLFQAMWGLWTVHFLRGELVTALAIAHQVQRMAIETADPMLQVAAHHALGYTHFYRGEYADAVREADAGLALFSLEREQQIAAGLQLSSSCAMWCFRAQSLQMLGRTREAAESVRGAQALDARLNHSPSRAFLLCLCYYFRTLDDMGEIQIQAPAVRALSVAEGFDFWVLVADILLAWSRARRGENAPAAAEQIASARQLLHQGLVHLVEPEYTAMHAEALLCAGRPQDVLAITAEALAIAQRGAQRHGESELYRLQGDAARSTGDAARAEACYRQAVASARAVSAPFMVLRAALALARLVGGPDELAELQTSMKGITEGFEYPDFQQARSFFEARRGTALQDPTLPV